MRKECGIRGIRETACKGSREVHGVHDRRDRYIDLRSRDVRRKLEEQGDYEKGRANFFAVRRPEWSLARCLGRATYGLSDIRRRACAIAASTTRSRPEARMSCANSVVACKVVAVDFAMIQGGARERD